MYMSRRETPPRDYLSPKNLSIMGVPRLFFEAEIEDFTGAEVIKETMRKYIDNMHNMFDDCINVTLFGSNGTGKTFLTSIIIKNAYRNRYSAKRITYSTFINLAFQKQTDESQYEIQKIHDTEFLVIDEIGKEVELKSGANISLLEELLKYREEKGFPTLICTNLTLEDIKLKYGSTISSLVTQSLKLEMAGEDVRGKMFRERNANSILRGGE